MDGVTRVNDSVGRIVIGMDDDVFRQELNRGAQLLAQGKAQQAQAILERLHKARPEDPAVAINLGGAYILSGRFKRAVPILEEVVARESSNAMAWTNLGAAYLGNPVLATIEQQDKAIIAFERALECDPAAPHVAYNLGLIYRDRDDRERAIHWFTRALQANPSDADARRILQRMQPKSEE
jgi:protein O-GlcNAc transferase